MQHSTATSRSYSSKDAFLAADYDAVISMLSQNRTHEEDIRLACCYIRMSRHTEAASVLESSDVIRTSGGLAIRANIETCLGNYDEAQAWIERAEALPLTVESRQRIRLERALLAYCRYLTDEAADLLEKPIPAFAQKFSELKAYVCIRRQQYREAIRYFESAADGPDQFLRYQALMAASFLVREMYFPDIMARIEEAATAGIPNKYLAPAYAHILRASAWCSAMRGKLAEANDRFRQASKYAQGAWRIALLIDKAQVAHAFGEPHGAWDRLIEAYDIAREIDWTVTQGEQRRVLLALAALLADRRLADARWCLRQYMTLPPTTGIAEWSRDIRSKAFEQYSIACIARADGREEEARAAFDHAFKIFRSVGYDWRAVLTLLARDSSAYGTAPEYVQQVLAHYPNSWIRSLVETQVECDPPEFLSLTQTERKVLALLVGGKTNPEIAAQLDRKASTISEHVSNIFRKLNCSSRSEIIRRYAALAIV